MTESQGIKPMSLSQLIAKFPNGIEWLVDGLLPASGTSVLVAKPKVGKSTLVRVLCVAVSQGAPFLHRRTRKGPVLYLALEENPGAVTSHFQELGATDENLHIHVGPPGSNPHQQLRNLAMELRPSLIIVDPLFQFVSVADSNQYAELTKALAPFYAFASSHECHVMLVHHAGKLERTGGDAILGSTAILGAVDTALMLNRRSDCRTIQTIQRYGTDLTERELMVSPDSRGVTLGHHVRTRPQSNLSEEILSAVGSEGLSGTAIKEKLKHHARGKVTDALTAMVNDGTLTKTGEGKRGRAFHYRKAESQSESQKTGTRDSGTKSSPRIRENREPSYRESGAPFPLNSQRAPLSDLGAA